MGNHTSGTTEPHTSQHSFSTGTSFMYNEYGTSTCECLQKWGDLTKSEISLRWLKWGSFDTSKLNFLHSQLEQAGSKTELNKWNTYLDWKIKDSKRSINFLLRKLVINF